MARQVVTRLGAPIAFLSALLLVLAVGAAWYVRSSQQAIAEMLSNHVASMRAAQELEISIREVRYQLDRYLATGDKSHLSSVPRLRKRTDAAMAAVEEQATTAEEQAFIRRTRQGYDHFFHEYDQALAKPPAQGLYLSITDLANTVLNREILDPAHEFLRLNEGMLARSSEENRKLADWLMAGLLGLGLCGSVGGGLVGWMIASTVSRQVQRTQDWLSETAKRLARVAQPARGAADAAGNPLDEVSAALGALMTRLRQTERDALRAERLALGGQMAAGIAHEVRNPLMTIKLLVQAAADRTADMTFRPRELGILEEEIVRLEQIVAGFLDFARPPRPTMRLVELGPLVRQAAESLQGRGELQGVRFSVDVGAGAVYADAHQVRQLVCNLMINALDALPGGGEVQVRTAGEGDEILLSIADDGPGLPAELGERIFDPFVSTKESGLGLGLSICRRIAEAHGGALRAENRLGGGAIFVARFPAPSAAAPSLA